MRRIVHMNNETDCAYVIDALSITRNPFPATPYFFCPYLMLMQSARLQTATASKNRSRVKKIGRSTQRLTKMSKYYLGAMTNVYIQAKQKLPNMNSQASPSCWVLVLNSPTLAFKPRSP